jgi:glycosyltransferase involved in cell wall biosynthesis
MHPYSDDSPRIVLVGPGPGVRGGIAQFNTHLAQALTREGATVTMVTFSRMYPRWTRAGRQGGSAATDLPGVVLKEVLIPWRPWTWISAGREIRDARANVMALQWWHPMFALCYAALAIFARARGTRTVFVCHNAEPHESFVLSDALTRLALRRGDQLFALSQAVADDLAALNPGTVIACLGHPPYTALSKLDPAAQARWEERINAGGKKVVLFFGNVRPYKGLSDLIAALPAIRSEVPVVLVVAGTFFESADVYRTQIRDSRLEGDVRLFPGYVPDGEVGALFAVADLVVLPYRSGSQTGIVPLAAQFGTPVVVTAVGGLSEGVGATSRVSPPGRPEKLAEAVVASLKDPAPAPPPKAQWHTWARRVIAVADVGDGN